MAEHVKATIEREVPPDVIRAEGEMLVALGLAPPSFDYSAAILALMSGELAGYYEPLDKTMYLAADLGETDSEATLSHELVHALQDQHYDLGKLLEFRADASDLQGAVHALAEGDATSAMLDAMLERQGAKATDLSEELLGPQLRASSLLSGVGIPVPDILKRSLVAPYVDGIEFVHALRRRAGWAEVDRAWKSPPISTEQLLHVEKYFAHEPPLEVPPPNGPEGTAGTPYTDVLGEESLRLILEEWVPRRTAVEAAQGWGGDRGAVFREGDRIAVAWHVRDDDVGSATRLVSALRRGVAAQQGSAVAPAAPDCAERATLGPLAVAQQGRDVAIVAGPYERRGPSTVSAGTCSRAKAWATRILRDAPE
jgi:hypothetical protein